MPVAHLAIGTDRPVGICVRVGAALATGMRAAERIGHGGMEAGTLHDLSLLAFLPIRVLGTLLFGRPEIRTQVTERDAEGFVVAHGRLGANPCSMTMLEHGAPAWRAGQAGQHWKGQIVSDSENFESIFHARYFSMKKKLDQAKRPFLVRKTDGI